MHELLANHTVRWQQQKMQHTEWQHRVALATRTRKASRRQRVTTHVQRLRTRRAQPDQALAAATR